MIREGGMRREDSSREDMISNSNNVEARARDRVNVKVTVRIRIGRTLADGGQRTQEGLRGSDIPCLYEAEMHRTGPDWTGLDFRQCA